MAVGDDMMEEDSLSSFLLDYVESKQIGDFHSLEDVAWADSCLVQDSEMSDGNWDNLKDALLDIITSKTYSLDLSAARRDGFTGGTDFEIISSSEAQTPSNLGSTVDDAVPCTEEVDLNGEDYVVLEEIDRSKSRFKFGNFPFLPNYIENLKEVENPDLGLGLGFPVFMTEPLSEDVFRIWDLDAPAEEHEFIKQLNKVLVESSLQPMPSPLDNSGRRKVLKEDLVGDLVAGITDMSLNRFSG